MLATAFENCTDILKVDWEMYYNYLRHFCPDIGQILSGEGRAPDFTTCTICTYCA